MTSAVLGKGPYARLRIAFVYNIGKEIAIHFKSLDVLKLAKDEPLKAIVTYTVDGDQGLNVAAVGQKQAGSFDRLGVNDFAVERLSSAYKGPFNADGFKECTVRYVLGWTGPDGLGQI